MVLIIIIKMQGWIIMTHISTILIVSLIGLLVGTIGTGLGGAVALLFRRPGEGTLSLMLALSAGLMLAVVFMDLAAEAFRVAPFFWGAAGIVTGVAFIACLDLVLPHFHGAGGEGEGTRYLRTGLLLGLGIAMHNLPEGLAIGAGYAHAQSLGAGIAILIGLQNLPEGVAMSVPLCMGGVCRRRVLGASILAGVPMGLGALLGIAFGALSPKILALALGFAGGAMLYITCDEMIPEAQRQAKGHSGTFGIVAGAVIGMAISAALH